MVAVSLNSQGWDTSSLVRLHDQIPLAQLARRDDPTFKLRGNSGFYDGAYFYAIARDPLATGQAHKLIEEAPYRYGHPAYGWLAWFASFGGRPSAVPDALLAVGLASIFLAGIAASLLAGALGWTLWGGLVVALNPGLIFSVGVDTTEPLGAALLLFGLLAYHRGRSRLAFALFAALCLVKEPLVLVPLAIAAWDLWRRHRPPILAAAVLPAVAWWLYLRVHLGAFPFSQGSQRLTAPLLGWEQALVKAASQSWDVRIDTTQLGQAAVPLIVAVGIAILVGAIYALRLRSVVDPAFLVLAGPLRVRRRDRVPVPEGPDPRTRPRARPAPLRARATVKRRAASIDPSAVRQRRYCRPTMTVSPVPRRGLTASAGGRCCVCLPQPVTSMRRSGNAPS